MYKIAILSEIKSHSDVIDYFKDLPFLVRSMRTETQPKMIKNWNLAQMFFNICKITKKKKKSPTIQARDHLQIHNGGYSKNYENFRKWPKIDIIKNRWFGVHFKDNLILITFLLTHKVQKWTDGHLEGLESTWNRLFQGFFLYFLLNFSLIRTN